MRQLVHCFERIIKSCHGRKKEEEQFGRKQTKKQPEQKLTWNRQCHLKTDKNILWTTPLGSHEQNFTWLSNAPHLEKVAVIRIASFFLRCDAIWVILRPLHHVLRATRIRTVTFLCNACCYVHMWVLLFVLLYHKA